MSTIDPSQITAADLSNPALSAQDLADITAARPDLRPYVATHPSLSVSYTHLTLPTKA